MDGRDVAELKTRLRSQWTALAKDWIDAVQTGGDHNLHREALLDSWMLNTVGDVRGQSIIDLGCGEGRFSRMLANRGARVTGIDLCEPFIEYARSHRVRDEDYVLGDMEDLGSFSSGSFDLAVSYVSLVDVVNLQAIVDEAYRVLRTDGRFIACNLHPMVTTGQGWIWQGNTRLYRGLDDYFQEGERDMPLFGNRVTGLHRTLSSYVGSFLASGFKLEGVREPKPTAEQVSRYPGIADNLRVPEFIIYLLRKPRT